MKNIKLKRIRQSLNLSQSDAAKALQVSQPYYSAVEGGKKPLSTKFIDKAVKVWNISPEDINGEIITRDETTGRRNDFDLGTFVDAIISYSQERSPVRHAKKLTSEEVDFEENFALEQLEEVYRDNQLLIETLSMLGATERVLAKFPPLPDFNKWHSEIEEDFRNEYSNLSGKELKLLKVEYLYHPAIEHRRAMLSKLIFYIHKSAKLFRDQNKPPQNF